MADLTSTDGALPAAPLLQGANGNFYGSGFGNGAGTIFEMTPGGNITAVYDFCSLPNCADGAQPVAGLILATNGNFYGTTFKGGGCGLPNGCGTVFGITPAGKLTTLYSFCGEEEACPGGMFPEGGVVQTPDGSFYGTTSSGGVFGTGTIFRVTAAGKATTLWTFCSLPNCADGEFPLAGLVLATNGNFYGTTGYNGAYLGGTIFEITPAGTFTTLYSFCSQPHCADGARPMGALIQASNGNFYGTTYAGGVNGYQGGTIFEITPSGKFNTMYTFCSQPNCADGEYPLAGLVQATDGNFYGTTWQGGAWNGDMCSRTCGTIFQITPAGRFTTLYTFCSEDLMCSDGWSPAAGLMQATDGNLYGTTLQGGPSVIGCGAGGCGTVYRWSMGLAPFIETLPTSGRVTTDVYILGTNLTGTTGVSFNGTPATFTVVSATKIETKVPTGATTGTVTVATPTGTLSSNMPFRVN